MEAKSHCKLHYGDGDFEEDALFPVSFYKTNVIVYFTFTDKSEFTFLL